MRSAVLRVLRGGLAQYTLRQPIGLYYRATVSSQVLERWQATFRDDKLDNKTVRHAMRCDAMRQADPLDADRLA
jgi:hypothetical protein